MRHPDNVWQHLPARARLSSRQERAEAGLVEGRNATIEFRELKPRWLLIREQAERRAAEPAAAPAEKPKPAPVVARPQRQPVTGAESPLKRTGPVRGQAGDDGPGPGQLRRAGALDTTPVALVRRSGGGALRVRVLEFPEQLGAFFRVAATLRVLMWPNPRISSGSEAIWHRERMVVPARARQAALPRPPRTRAMRPRSMRRSAV